MAAARIARLTLFSGPNCSLCDVAKAELVKVRQSRPFTLETINIQDRGQEKWKRKYVYWIPALHLEGKEVAKGRWTAHEVNQALDEWESQTESKTLENEKSWQEPYGVYARDSETILGDQILDAAEVANPSIRRCFNCGSPDHPVSSCLFRLDHRLIALSRAFFNFLQTTRADPDFERLHLTLTWRQQRLQWTDMFEPGKVNGTLLLDALQGRDGDWLKNIAIWGYPKGWASATNPRDNMRRRIQMDDISDDDDDDDDNSSFIILGDGEVEEIQLSAFKAADAGLTELADSRGTQRDITSGDESPHPTSDLASAPLSRRWATYPSSYFSSDLLPIYDGHSLPPIPPQESNTYTEDRQSLWECIVSGNDCPNSFSVDALRDTNLAPWRLPGAFSDIISPTVPPRSSLPPPPTTSPPPLPLGPSPVAPRLPSSADQPDNLEEELDMDVSD